ncbi:MAG: DUF3040 domain-containing protein [Actinobacteria bacterium]|nr:MAG: hypothetical protein ABR57_05750 [Acidimicrobium sp. BACL17 MAG-120924-bin0]MDA0191928.1 DUF3040 domain-containing protein [Actinomycetota bacterium]MDA2951546.1 DUF3040 domain-containing protein [Actinomycetota bacterium]MDA2998578.1 DUF3040 domain-containing protein [Actinomycetota bacterium]
MPLSDDEKRILSELEEQLQTDTKFANAVSSSGLYSYAIRKVRWATLGVLVSLVFTVLTLQIHFLVAFLGFLGMLACVLVIEHQLRAMSKAGMKDVADTLRSAAKVGGFRARNIFDREQ